MAGFTIKSRDLALASDPSHNQSKIFDTDIEILQKGLQGYGVVTGCEVTEQGTPDMTVAVEAGEVQFADGSTATVSAGNVTVGTAHASNPRLDLITASNVGAKT